MAYLMKKTVMDKRFSHYFFFLSCLHRDKFLLSGSFTTKLYSVSFRVDSKNIQCNLLITIYHYFDIQLASLCEDHEKVEKSQEMQVLRKSSTPKILLPRLPRVPERIDLQYNLLLQLKRDLDVILRTMVFKLPSFEQKIRD